MAQKSAGRVILSKKSKRVDVYFSLRALFLGHRGTRSRYFFRVLKIGLPNRSHYDTLSWVPTESRFDSAL